MSKAFGGIDNLVKPKYKREREKIRASHMAQAEADLQLRRKLQALKDRMDLFGEDALSDEEKALVASRAGFFFPEGRTR